MIANREARTAGLAKARPISVAKRKLTSEEGIRWARDWRERNRGRFDAIFGAECCGSCGRAL